MLKPIVPTVVLLAVLLVACSPPPPTSVPTVRVIPAVTKLATATRALRATLQPTKLPTATPALIPTRTPTFEPTATTELPTQTPTPTITLELTVTKRAPVIEKPTAVQPTATPLTAQPTGVTNPQADARPCAVGQIKGNRNSMIYHVPSGEWYARTHNNVICFNTEAEAQAAGFRKSKR